MITDELARRAERLASDRVPFVVATVVRAGRPASVRPGDAALVLGEGTIEGFVGGTCAEASVRLHALRVLETGEPLLLRLVPGGAAGADEGPGDGAVVEHNPCLSGGSLEIFLEPRLPAARIVVLGDTPVARALGDVGRAAGFDVVAGGSAGETGVAAVVVATHGRDEEGALAAALAAGVPYVGLVASRARGAAVRDALEVADELRAQLHTPAGLDLGGRSPAEIAIAILAEIVAEGHAGRRVDAAAEAARPAGPATAVDPVCGMEVAVTEATPRLELGGTLVYFCCEGCRERYAARHAGGLAAG